MKVILYYNNSYNGGIELIFDNKKTDIGLITAW